MEEEKFDLVPTLEPERQVLDLKDYDQAIAAINDYLATKPAFLITDDKDATQARKIRAEINSFAKNIDRLRIDTIADFTTDFTEKCKNIVGLLKARADEIGDNIKEYDKTKELVAAPVVETKPTMMKFIIEVPSEKVLTKLTDFCTKNGCTLTSKK